MDAKEYQLLYNQLMSQRGRNELGEEPYKRISAVDKINQFLKDYPRFVAARPERDPNAVWTSLSVQEVFHRSILTAIDIINDISAIVDKKDTITTTEFRRSIFAAFTRPERAVYIGLWLIFFSFVLYFIDSTA